MQAITTPLNRAERRARKKAERGSSKPRSKHSTRRLINPVDFAICGAALPCQAEKQRILALANTAIDAFRTGKGTYRQWQQLTSLWNVLCSANQISIVRGMDAYLDEIEKSTRSIFRKASGGDSRTDKAPASWTTPTLHHDELEGLRLCRDLYKFMIETISQRQYEEVFAHAVARVRTAGGLVTDRNGNPC